MVRARNRDAKGGLVDGVVCVVRNVRITRGRLRKLYSSSASLILSQKRLDYIQFPFIGYLKMNNDDDENK